VNWAGVKMGVEAASERRKPPPGGRDVAVGVSVDMEAPRAGED
jgi:hypothetical protein